MNKDYLIQHIEAMNAEQIEFLSNLLNFANYPDYSTKMKICGIDEEEKRKIDSATPSEYNNAIFQIYPDFRNGHNVYNYNKSNFGEMQNLNNRFFSNLHKILNLETL